MKDPGYGENLDLDIDGQKVEIRWVSNDALARDHAGHHFAGDYDHNRQRIRLTYDGNTRKGWRMTIFHELMHHAHNRDGLKLTAAQKEDMAGAAEWLLIALWDNPKLAKILLEVPKK